MAVISISKIQVRSGYQEDLPALDTGEFGWCVDTQRLYIGKGSVAEGAPETGVTEILTQYSQALIYLNFAQTNSNVANLASTVSNIQAILSGSIANLAPITAQLLDNQSVITNIGMIEVTSLSSCVIDYNITRLTAMRTGILKIANYSGTSVGSEDEYVETAATGITLYVTGNTASGNAVIGYTSTSTGYNANITYNFTSLRTLT
jgi:type IV secretory pathway VirB2 component (pilin)